MRSGLQPRMRSGLAGGSTHGGLHEPVGARASAKVVPVSTASPQPHRLGGAHTNRPSARCARMSSIAEKLFLYPQRLGLVKLARRDAGGSALRVSVVVWDLCRPPMKQSSPLTRRSYQVRIDSLLFGLFLLARAESALQTPGRALKGPVRG